MGIWNKVGSVIGLDGGKGGVKTASDTVGSIGSESLASAGEGVVDGASSAWDVMSGERDWRRQRKLQEETWAREDSAFQRAMADLEKAGINPMLAGQLGGSPTSAPVAKSHSAESVGRTLSLAGGVLAGSTSAAKAIAETGLARSSSARNLADAAAITARLPAGIAKDVAQAGLYNAQVPHTQAMTAESLSRRLREDSRFGYEVPRLKADSDYHKRYGRSAVLAREIRNPWQAGMLVADQAGRGPVERATNSAASVMARQSARLNVESLRKKTSQYARRSSAYYTGRR